ncbi:MAG: alpha-ketoglutarate-dependent dioxygenase AlkB [SAR86 cluster bacterium]|uniref:Alpha-ketoglutarate-dependent dioxygenase AlkB n=1 Tax=SAR86 cluster bacterium TaxID=2030880 RepID=A0A2A5B4P6_9GAMM|nr:MAG: alpha-ketoglutarate-dependent dioxygenase AlkB [SAR86 cluster bacterium]
MQANLFDDSSNPDQFIQHDLGDSDIKEYPCAFAHSQSNILLQQLIDSIPWHQESIKIAGKVIQIPRLQCWMGDAQSVYGYSGMRLKPIAWNQLVTGIRDRVQILSNSAFNSVLINYYRSGDDSVAWHADDEPELGSNPVIASVSFGAERYFQLKQKHSAKPQKFQLKLRNGSLLIMGGSLQNNWLHQLPKVKGLALPRINLTFRNIV